MANNINPRFSYNPTGLVMRRSRFDMPFNHKSTITTGKLGLLAWQEVLPGDTFSVKSTLLIRSSTPIVPVMDNAFFDYYYFFVPMRLVWDKTKEFFGENTQGFWAQTEEETIPEVIFEYSPEEGTLADMAGLPVIGKWPEGAQMKVNALLARAYCLVWNEYFRDQNTQAPQFFDKGSDPAYFVPYDNNSNGANVYGKLLDLNKYHDLYTSALPEPQKGPAVGVPLVGSAPVFAGDNIPLAERRDTQGLILSGINGTSSIFRPSELYINGSSTSGYPTNVVFGRSNDSISSPSGSETQLTPANLYADLENASAITINSIRQMYAIQRLLEIDARGGTRYIESLRAHFGVSIAEGVVQRPEILSGRRVPISMASVAQTSSSDSETPQGNLAAFSVTGDSEGSFSKSFVEHGLLLCVGGVRTAHTYQQGIHPYFSKRRRFDFYYPELANLGEQPILRKELVFTGTDIDDEVFGFQEAWYDYRYTPNRVSGKFRNNVSNSLSYWTYADYFGNPTPDNEQIVSPVLNSDFMKETSENVERTLALSSDVFPQWFFDFQMDLVATRVMPLYSIPGWSDRA